MAQLRNLDQRLRVIEEERQGELTFLRNAIRQNQQRLNNLFGRCGEPDAAGCPCLPGHGISVRNHRCHITQEALAASPRIRVNGNQRAVSFDGWPANECEDECEPRRLISTALERKLADDLDELIRRTLRVRM